MFKDKIIEPTGFIVAIATAIFSLILFYSQTQMFFGSVMAALIASALCWVTYIILRWVILAFRE